MNENHEITEISGKGRGRGRGGGVPILPVGMWNEINNVPDSQLQGGVESSRKANQNDYIEENRQTLEEMKHMTFGGFGRGRGKLGFADKGSGSDWDCPSCGNTNWSWRTMCNRCSTPKPVVKVYTEGEIRDGAGGGFNERQDRVATTTVEIAEDGFDDFGRRVKGGRQDKSAKELAALARLQNNYGFLLNPESVSGQFDDSFEEKPSKQLNTIRGTPSKSDHSLVSNSSSKYVPPKGKDERQSKEKNDRRSRSRERNDRRDDERDRNHRERERSKERNHRRERSRDRSRERRKR